MKNRKKKFTWRILACLIWLSLQAFACTALTYSLADVTPMTSTSMVIFERMTRNFSGAHGLLNIYLDPEGLPNSFTPSAVQEKTELTATLWLVIDGRPETYTSFQVRSGQVIIFEGYKIEILRIGENAKGANFIEIDVTEAH